MSRATCPKCGNTDVSWIRDDADCAQYICLECKQGFCYPPKTVFDKITESVETMAEKMVYAVHYGGLYFWHSTLIYPAFPFKTREEAIAATMEELKKEWKK